jgi:hypothetical protein
MQTPNSESFCKYEFDAPHPKPDENGGPSACVRWNVCSEHVLINAALPPNNIALGELAPPFRRRLFRLGHDENFEIVR